MGYGVATGFGLPFMADKVFPFIFGETDVDTMKRILVVSLLPLAFIARGTCGFFNTYLVNYCGAYVLEKIRKQLFGKLQDLPYRFYQKHQPGDLISRAVSDTQNLQEQITTVAHDVLKQPVTFIGAIGALVFMAITKPGMDYVLGCLALIPLCVIPVRQFGRKIQKRAQQMQEQTGDLSADLSENLSAHREIRAFNLQEPEKSKFAATISKLFISRMKVIKYYHLLNPTIEILTSFGIAAAVFYASTKELDLEDLLPVIMALYLSYEPLKKLGAIHTRLKQATASLERIEYVLEHPLEIEDPAEPVPLDKVLGKVEFKGVTFKYEEDQAALSSINVRIEPGEIVALVGPSGAGKTTFANLIPRFYDPSEGQLLVDGTDISQVSQAVLRENIAYVPQHPVLFNDTLRNNILLGKSKGSQISVEEAAKLACADTFIEGFTDGYETQAGEKGGRLSGGQIQRIAIARALIRNASILILDEATSALDAESESAIQTALQNLIKDKTVFIIAHRFTTITLATRILVFEDGRIIADGPHDKLIGTCPLYKRLHDSQK